MSPDLNLHPTLIDADRPDDLAWIYQADSALRPSAIDLNQLVVEVDWGLKRMVWVIYGSCHPDLIKKVVANITPCSRVILLEEGQPNDYSLTQQERGELLNLIEGGQLALVVGGTALQRAEKVAGMIDINLWDGWKPLLSRESMETKAELPANL